MNKTTEFKFSVDSALLRELGEKLVSTVHVAVAELVKNAYDADATILRIKIKPTDTGGPEITIEDNGTGMTSDQVASFWMRIGTSNKESKPVSHRFGRLLTGKKGVGRFACRRLGSALKLETLAISKDQHQNAITVRTVVDFDWNSFLPGSTVESIPCKGWTQTYQEIRATGTKLVISGAAADEWQMRGFDYLRRQLAVMAANSGTKRVGYADDPGFEVELEAPGLSKTQGDIRAQIIEGSWGTLEAEVLDDGCASFTLHAFGISGKRTFLTSSKFKPVAGATLKLGILPLSKDEVRDPSLLANYVLANLSDEWGGTQVRYNGFRMYPYGNPGDDWLNIDADRGRRLAKPTDDEVFSFASSVQRVNPSKFMLNMLSSRSYLGHVNVSSAMPGLEPRMDRQGFVDSETFELVRRFVRMAIEWASVHREAFIRQREISAARQAIADVSPILNADPKQLDPEITPRATQYLRQEIKRLVTTLPAGEQAKTQQSLLRTVNAIEAISAENQSQLRHLRLVASASTLTLLFAHEVRSSISALSAGSARLRTLAKKVPDYQTELVSLSQQLGSSQTQLSRLVDMTGIVGAFRRDQRLAEVNLRLAVERAIGCFRLVIENYSIRVDLEKVNSSILVGPIVEGELYSIIINLISNAIKSLIANGKSEKLIRLWTQENGRKAFLRIADNGIGLDAKYFSDVFTPFIADPSGLLYDQLEVNANPEDAALFGTGSGLGLSIARDIARARGGDIKFINPDSGWATCVEIALP